MGKTFLISVKFHSCKTIYNVQDGHIPRELCVTLNEIIEERVGFAGLYNAYLDDNLEDEQIGYILSFDKIVKQKVGEEIRMAVGADVYDSLIKYAEDEFKKNVLNCYIEDMFEMTNAVREGKYHG